MLVVQTRGVQFFTLLKPRETHRCRDPLRQFSPPLRKQKVHLPPPKFLDRCTPLVHTTTGIFGLNFATVPFFFVNCSLSRVVTTGATKPKNQNRPVHFNIVSSCQRCESHVESNQENSMYRLFASDHAKRPTVYECCH